jgi:ankyrin repeat protein
MTAKGERPKAGPLSAFCILHSALILAVALSPSDALAADSRVALAAKSGDAAAVRALVQQRADVNAPEVDGTTALHWAVRSGDADLVGVLLRAGAKAAATNRYGMTPLLLAASNGHAAIVDALLKAGAKADGVGPEGETPLMLAARSGSAAAVNLLLEAGASVHAKEQWHGQTALMWAAAENHPAVVAALVARGAEVNGRSNVLQPPQREILDFRTDKNGQALQTLLTTFPRGGLTPLLFAARQGSLEATRALVDAGADLNLADPEGISPLVLAIRNGHYEVAALLVEKGANVNAVDRVGRTALYMSVDMHTLDWIQNRPAPKSEGALDSVALAKLLLEKGANPNVQLSGNPPGWKGDAIAAQNTFGNVVGAGTTPFVRAAKNADLAVMRLLIEKGANPAIATRNRTTALMALVGGLGRRYGADLKVSAAEEKNALEAAKLLLDLGADVNAANEAGQTSLHAAAAIGANGIVRFLVERGARVDAKTRQGRTALDEALRGVPNVDGAPGEAHDDTAALLRELMAQRGIDAQPSAAVPAAPPAEP